MAGSSQGALPDSAADITLAADCRAAAGKPAGAGDDGLLAALYMRMWTLASGRPLPSTPARPASGQVCTLLAFDIDGFTRPDRDEDIRIHLHKAFREIPADAFEGSGLPWHQCHHEDRGEFKTRVAPASRKALCRWPGWLLIAPMPR